MSSVDSKRENSLILADVAATAASFFLALYIRYQNNIADWQREFYYTLLIVLLLLEIVYHYNERKTHRFDRVLRSDPAENLAMIIKDRSLLVAALVGVLFATHNSAKISRLVLGYLYILDLVLDYILHMMLRQLMRNSIAQKKPSKHILIVTTSELAEVAIARVSNAISEDTDIVGLAYTDCTRIGDRVDGLVVIDDKTSILTADIGNKVYNEAFLYLPYADFEEINELIEGFERIGVTGYQILCSHGEDFTANRLREVGDYRAVVFSCMQERCKVLGVSYTVANVDNAVYYVRKHLEELKGNYICFGNAHTTVMSREDFKYLTVQNGSSFTFPDGASIVRVQIKRGHQNAQRVAGPDFMGCMFRDSMDGSVTHFFYGSTEDTVQRLQENLKKKYKGIIIKGVYSPPFRELTKDEDDAIIDMLNSSGADIVWVGLGAPKQEIWMEKHRGTVNGLMVGVGAGFNFYAETVKRAPQWIQRIGMEWAYRMTQEPKKLIKRYLVSNIKFLAYSLFDSAD